MKAVEIIETLKSSGSKVRDLFDRRVGNDTTLGKFKVVDIQRVNLNNQYAHVEVVFLFGDHDVYIKVEGYFRTDNYIFVRNWINEVEPLEWKRGDFVYKDPE